MMQRDPAFFQHVGFCAGLSSQVFHDLDAIAIPLERSARTIIQLEGEPAERMYIVVTGQVKISRIANNGREQVLSLIGRGGHFNTVAIFDGGPCPANAEAISDVTLLALSRHELLPVLAAHPPLMLALLREFAGHLRNLVDLVDSLALHSVQGRLAGLLISHAEAAMHHAALPPLTQAEMAARIGTVREMVGRTLKMFESQGLIRLERGAIVVLDWVGLARQRDL